MTQPDWSVVFFVEDNGRRPVNEFLEGLDDMAQGRFVDSIERLRFRNVLAQEPLVRHLEGKLWELREEAGNNAYRIVYFFFTGRQIVLVHGFQKKTRRTPRGEIELAERRMQRFLAREGSDR